MNKSVRHLAVDILTSVELNHDFASPLLDKALDDYQLTGHPDGRPAGIVPAAGLLAERLAGVVALSTYLIDAPGLAAEAAAANRDVPIFMAHGTYDPVVHVAWAEQSRDALAGAGWRVEWHAYPMEHAAEPEEIAAVGEFLRRVLPA